MNLNEFRRQFKNVNGFYITKNWILFRKPLELWNEKTNKSIKARKLEELLDVSIDNKTISKHIENLKVLDLPKLDGGRGQSNRNLLTFKFSHAKQLGPDKTSPLLPAYANTRIKSKTLENAMQEFREKHKSIQDKEWAYEVDQQGFVHQYKKGNRASISIYSSVKDSFILHNHPDGGAFSDGDLLSTSMDKRSKGIVATDPKFDYVFKKGTHFKANDFIKAVKNSKLKGKDYSDAVDKWLKKNQKKYGYTYYKTSNHLSKSK